MMKHYKNMMTRFFIYGTVGWIAEVLWTGFGSLLRTDFRLTSHTYLWMLFIYGLAVFLEPVHDAIRSWHWFYRGLLYMFLIFSVEYFSGWLLSEVIGVCPWDYGNQLFAINGFIRLDYAPVWFTAGLLFEKLHDFLDNIMWRLTS